MRNGISYFKSEGILDNEVAALKTRIQDYKPNIVFGLGSDVLTHLFGYRGVLKWRGHTLWSEELGCKVLISFDPFHAYTQTQVEKKQKPGQYQTLLQCDVGRALEESQFSQLQHAEPELIIAPSFHHCKAELERMLREAKIISYDIEVFQPYNGRLMDCIGLCDNTNTALCVPFYCQNPENKIQRYWKNDSEYHQIWTLVKQILESQIPKVAQNSQFDTTMLLKYYGISANNVVWDTMLVAHNLYCDLPKDLGTLISLYTRLPYHKYMIHEKGDRARWLYNAADAVANLHVMQGQIKEIFEINGKSIPELPVTGEIPAELFDLGVSNHYFRITNPGIDSCVKMHIAGVHIDMELREKVLDVEGTYIFQLLEALNKAIPYRFHKDKKKFENFGPTSPKQKNKLLYDFLQCPIQRKNKKLSSGKDALAALLQVEHREYVRTLIKCFMEVKAADARLLKFKIEPDGEYIRTQYDLAGTDTGRLASKESDVMKAGNNLQNIAVGPQRQMIIPEKGEKLAHVDLYAAEAYLNALDSGEMGMLRMISGVDEERVVYLDHILKGEKIRVMDCETAKKYKIHNWMSNWTHERYPAECEAANYTYKKAKQTIHGLNYNVLPPKMAMESGLPSAVTQCQYNMYHTKFPGIQDRMKRINEQIRRTKSMVSALGRRRVFMQPVCKDLFNSAYAWPSQSTIGELDIIAQNYINLIGDLHELGFNVPFMRTILNTHDGLAIRYKENEEALVIPYIVRAFNTPLTLNGVTIRIPVSIGWGDTFNDNEDELVYFYPLDL
jgi:DNA polymerase I-like protein with 3'-5' exonuclease and polymerase domains